MIDGLANFIQLAEDQGDHEVRQVLARIRQGVSALGRGRRPLARWLSALATSLDEIGARDGLAADSAGVQLLELMDRLGQDLRMTRSTSASPTGGAGSRASSRPQHSATAESRARWSSPVSRRRRCASSTRCWSWVAMPRTCRGRTQSRCSSTRACARSSGCPTWADRMREMEAQLAPLIASCGTVVVTWQRTLGGEPNPLSPFIERLAAVHRLAYGSSLEEDAAAARLAVTEVRATGAAVPSKRRAGRRRVRPRRCCRAGSRPAATTRSLPARTSSTRATCWDWPSSTTSRS